MFGGVRRNVEASTADLEASIDDRRDVLATRCDVADEDHVADAIAKTVETFGSLDLAYNNAGIQSPMTDAADETADVFDHWQRADAHQQSRWLNRDFQWDNHHHRHIE